MLRPAPATASRGSQRVRSSDSGSVTAETAVVLPVLVVVLAAGVWALSCVAAQLSCVDAARAAARAAARGDSPAVVRDTGSRLAPDGAVVEHRPSDGTVEVRVSAEVRPFGGVLRVLPALHVSGRATAAVEGVMGSAP